uniref:3CxxC-type domain-containing protein n=1 Tax=Leptobrachium leishanense TaxID=445787 RepID=A0A8C5MTN5_9ANUR
MSVKSIFNSEITKAGIVHDWTLINDPNLCIHNPKEFYKQKTVARFQCSSCRKSWQTDMCLICFSVTLNKRSGQGTVLMRIFRQECSKCSSSTLEDPVISAENMSRFIGNLVNYIQRKFYNKSNEGNELKPHVYYHSDGPHDRQHCEACKHGLCSETDGGQEQDNTGTQWCILA